MQFVRSSAKVFRDSGEDAVTHDHDTTTAGEPQRESNKEIFLLIYRYNCTKSKIFAKKVKKNLEIQFFAVSL